MRFLPPEWVERVTSTNSALLERLREGAPVPHGAVLATTDQTAGRGRGANRWIAHPGLDLACSFVLRTAVEVRQLVSLSVAVALGVSDLLREYDVAGWTKWPNDVVVEGRKICGILPELCRRGPSPGAGSGPSHATGPYGAATGPPDDRAPGRVLPGPDGAVVVGVGLNLGLSRDEVGDLDQPATSLFLETGRAPPATDVLPRLLAALTPRLDVWQDGGFEALRSDWEARCLWLGKAVIVVDGATRRRGRLAGFGACGELLLDEGAGPVAVWAGQLRRGA